MRKIYSRSGEIHISSNNEYYFFHNYETSMDLKLYKKDISYFMDVSTYNIFSTIRSCSNFMTDNEKEAIKSYLRIKNKRLKKIKSMINNGEKLEDVINIMPLNSLMEYIGDNQWKKL